MGPTPELKTIEQKVNKISVIGDRVIVAGTGEIGLGQRFNAVVKTAWHHKDNPFSEPPLEVGKYLAHHAIADFQSTCIKTVGFGSLVAFPTEKQSHLCEFVSGNFQPELKTNDSLWYASMDGTLRWVPVSL